MGNAQRILEQHGYTKMRKIGKGGFGKAILVKCKEDGEHYILKEIKLLSEEAIRDAKLELNLLMRMDHKFIVRYKESFAEGRTLFIAMEYCEQGDLGKVVDKQLEKGHHFQEKEVGKIVREIKVARR